MSHLDIRPPKRPPGRPSLARKEQEILAAALFEKEKRRVRKIQSERGGFLEFVKYFWDVLEPSTTFVYGWAFEAICRHLEAVTFGEIKRILINVPPGFSKSMLTDVFWPAWEWSAMDRPHLRYVTFSYSSYLTERDNDRFCKLITSEKFRSIWGDKFTVTAEGKVKIANNKTGWKFASSVGGVGTGERGNRVVCFPYAEKVWTEFGPIEIGKLVDERRPIRVWSLNKVTGFVELKPVVGWHKNPSRPLVRIRTRTGIVTCTEDHRIITASGDREASSLVVGDFLLAAPSWVGVSSSDIRGAQVQPEMRPRSTCTDIGNCAGAYSKLCRKGICCIVMSAGNLLDHLFCKMGCAVTKRAVLFAIRDVVCPRAVFEIAQASIAPVPILMSDFLPVRNWTQESHRDQTMHKSIDGPPFSSQCDTRISVCECRIDRVHDFSLEGNWPSICPSSHDNSRQASNSSEIGNLVSWKSLNRLPILSEIVGIDHVIETPESTYCLTVADNHTMICGEGQGILCSNCDDPNNLVQAESDIVRAETNRWFEESVQSRLNDIATDAIIVIMQRLNGFDVSGLILEKFHNYVHLMIPMEYEADRHCTTSIGWSDPRTTDGELAWPERFPPHILKNFRENEYMWAGQYQQRPQLRGMAILKESYWQPWDQEASIENGCQVGTYPPFEYIVGCLDTAMTEKKQNDPTAFLALGVWRNKYGNRRAMLIYAWTGRFEFHDLITQIALSCRKCRIQLDKLLIEAKANGHSVEQELRRIHHITAHEGGNPLAMTSISLWDPGRGDKVSRAMAVQPMLERGVLYYPATTDTDGNVRGRAFAEAVIRQAADFPRGRHDDLVDCLTMGLSHLRMIGMLTTPEEDRMRLNQELSDYRQPAPLYPGM